MRIVLNIPDKTADVLIVTAIGHRAKEDKESVYSEVTTIHGEFDLSDGNYIEISDGQTDQCWEDREEYTKYQRRAK